MVRISKQQERRNQCPRRPLIITAKNAAVAQQKQGSRYRVHLNAIEGDLATTMFVPKIR